MFKFFTQKKWFLWSIFGSLFILVSTWYQVQLDVRINEWFEESKKESWVRLHFCQDTGDKGRKIILVGRGF